MTTVVVPAQEMPRGGSKLTLLHVALCTEGVWQQWVGLVPCEPPGPQAESSVQAGTYWTL